MWSPETISTMHGSDSGRCSRVSRVRWITGRREGTCARAAISGTAPRQRVCSFMLDATARPSDCPSYRDEVRLRGTHLASGLAQRRFIPMDHRSPRLLQWAACSNARTRVTSSARPLVGGTEEIAEAKYLHMEPTVTAALICYHRLPKMKWPGAQTSSG